MRLQSAKKFFSKSPTSGFGRFPELPSEIQILIWEIAVAGNQPQIIEIEVNKDGKFRSKVPSLLRTCSNSRTAALKRYHWICNKEKEHEWINVGGYNGYYWGKLPKGACFVDYETDIFVCDLVLLAYLISFDIDIDIGSTTELFQPIKRLMVSLNIPDSDEWDDSSYDQVVEGTIKLCPRVEEISIVTNTELNASLSNGLRRQHGFRWPEVFQMMDKYSIGRVKRCNGHRWHPEHTRCFNACQKFGRVTIQCMDFGFYRWQELRPCNRLRGALQKLDIRDRKPGESV